MRRRLLLPLILLLVLGLFVSPAEGQYRRKPPRRPQRQQPKQSQGEDYYKLLGIPRSADDRAIKKAFRKLSVQWHPDKNPDNKEEAEEKFKKIAAAYTVLSDPEKRKIYDMGGEEAIKGGAGAGGGGNPFGGGFDPNEIFKQFFGAEGGSPFGDGGNIKFSFGGSPGGGGGFGGFGGGGSPFGGMGGEPEPEEPPGGHPPAESQMHAVRLAKPKTGGLGSRSTDRTRSSL